MADVKRFDSDGKTCLANSAEEQFMWLLRFATVKQIKDFLTKNPSIDARYPTGNLKTPVTSAIDRGDPQILSLLLDKSCANLDDTTTQACGRTALMYASYVSRNPEVLQTLLKKGADLGKQDTRGWTCLQYAIVAERSKNVTFLLNSGAPVNREDLLGRTPLMISAYRSNPEILSLLLDHGADIHARDNAGFTALQIAILWRKRDAAVVLIERGSDVSVVTPLTKASIGELCRTTMPNILRCLEPKAKIGWPPTTRFRYNTVGKMRNVSYNAVLLQCALGNVKRFLQCHNSIVYFRGTYLPRCRRPTCIKYIILCFKLERSLR